MPSQECKDAYIRTTCITAVPECCSTSEPVHFHPCKSVCEDMLDKCGDEGRALQDCSNTKVWYDSPCNDGNGGGC